MAENGVTATDVCNTLGFPMPTFSDWIREKTYPRIDKIEKMANYFGIQKSDLIEEEIVETASPAKQLLLNATKDLSEEQILKLLGIIDEAKKLL